ncbi:unnamed protein product [Prorocentrum cordatum]|uniref:Cellulase n=1 Tax=Prorocentrum cordatum TaxID=2364126 RepID=A0ABN9XY19_9DINO|nr:unnamed protein product [Polarella glacialis]
MAHPRCSPAAALALWVAWAAAASGDEASAALRADGACAGPACGAGGDALGLLQTRGAARVAGGASSRNATAAAEVDAGQVAREGGVLALSDRGNLTDGGNASEGRSDCNENLGQTYDVCFFANVWLMGDVMCAQSCGWTHMALSTFCKKEKGTYQNDINCGTGYSCAMDYRTLMKMKGYDPNNLSTANAMGATGLAANGVEFFAKSTPGCSMSTIGSWIR